MNTPRLDRLVHKFERLGSPVRFSELDPDTHRAFIDAMGREPDNPDIPMAFADWLAENGKPVHAEIIKQHGRGLDSNYSRPSGIRRQVAYGVGLPRKFYFTAVATDPVRVDLHHLASPHYSEHVWEGNLPMVMAADKMRALVSEGATPLGYNATRFAYPLIGEILDRGKIVDPYGTVELHSKHHTEYDGPVYRFNGEYWISYRDQPIRVVVNDEGKFEEA